MDLKFLADTFRQLVAALPLTLELAFLSILVGMVLALCLALCRTYGPLPIDLVARAYIYVFRGTPLLVQIFLIYYGLGQFQAVRDSALWTYLREPYWCALLALSLNTGAYCGEILRGGMMSVPLGQTEAAKACGMSRLTAFRRVTLPLAVRQAIPAYTNEIIAITKSTSLVSLITLMELTGVAARIISETYRVVEVLSVAGLIYLSIIFLLTRAVQLLEHYLNPHLRDPKPLSGRDIGTELANGDAR